MTDMIFEMLAQTFRGIRFLSVREKGNLDQLNEKYELLRQLNPIELESLVRMHGRVKRKTPGVGESDK